MDLKLQFHDAEKDIKIYASDFSMGENVTFGGKTRIVSPAVNIGDSAVFGVKTDIRASSISIGEHTLFADGARVLCPENFSIGAAGRVDRNSVIETRNCDIGDEFFFGEGSAIGFGGRFGRASDLKIGHQVAVSSRNVLNTSAPITLGNRVGTSDDVYFLTHGLHHSHSVLLGYPLSYEPIVVDDNVWFGMRTLVMPGVHVGRNTIIASNSVVLRDLPPDILAAGVPAVRKKDLRDTPAAEDQQIRMASDIMDRWIADLETKGSVTVHRETIEGGPDMRYEIGFDERTYSVVLCYALDAGRVPGTGDRQIAVTLNSGKLREDEHSGLMLFDLTEKTASSELDGVGEDLRDFLRRHSLACFNRRRFASLPPKEFAWLRLYD